MSKNFKTLLAGSVISVPFLFGGIAHAQTTTSTNPTTILTTMETATQKVDDIGGVAAAMGMATTVFAGGALVFKRFIYS